MTAKQLKNSILKEAVQGKLVSQNNEDEPSSELLKRIKSERDKLINSNNNVASAHCVNIQKKARKGLKPLVSSIYRKGNSFYEKRGKDEICIDAELPFEIPKSWELVRLKELCRLIDGEYREEELIILDAKFLRGKSEGIKSNSGKYVSAGDYLILVDGENSGEVFKAPINGYLGSTFKILWIAPFININYILYFIELYKLPLKNSKKGVAIPHLNRDLFFNLLLPLPPIEEQKRIVNKLNELMPLIEEYEKLETELNELDKKFPERLKKSILKEAVQGKLVSQNNKDEPSSELLKRIKSERDKLINSNNNVASAHCVNIQKKARKGLKPLVSSIYRKGNSFYEKKGKDEICIDAELPFEIPKTWELVRLKELCRLIDGEYREEELIILDAKFLRGKSEGIKSNSGKYVSAGDYLILVDGENSGEVFKAPINGYLGSTFKILWITPFININYILYFIELYKLPLKNSKKGVAIPHLNRDLFFNLLLPIPPIEEQKRIVEKLDKLMELCEELKRG